MSAMPEPDRDMPDDVILEILCVRKLSPIDQLRIKQAYFEKRIADLRDKIYTLLMRVEQSSCLEGMRDLESTGALGEFDTLCDTKSYFEEKLADVMGEIHHG